MKTIVATALAVVAVATLTACGSSQPVVEAPRGTIAQFQTAQAPLITYLQNSQSTLAAQGWSIAQDSPDPSANTSYIAACDTAGTQFKPAATLTLTRGGTLNQAAVDQLSQFLVNQAVADQMLQVRGPLDDASMKSAGVDLQYVFTKDSNRYVYNLVGAATAPVISIDATGPCIAAPTTADAAVLRAGVPLFAG
ncbi:hypothetical protein JT358_12325 [Micrococcales bacterium 31B]|nr:hypothetical protein [Micrococcales bacterium 31B]